MFHVTIIQAGTSPKVVEAQGNLRETLSGQGIDLGTFSVMRGGVPTNLDTSIDGDVTVSVTKKSVGA